MSAWCSARISKRCRADSGLTAAGGAGTLETKRPAQTELHRCVSCGMDVCEPCSVELRTGEWECKPCARADVRGAAS